MSTQFPGWLAQLARDGNGPLEMPSIKRGREHAVTLKLAADFSADSFTMEMRASPDASGDPLAIFTCTPGSFADGVTPITIVLASNAQGDIPANADGSGVDRFVYDLWVDPDGSGAPYRLVGGIQPVSGVVTQP